MINENHESKFIVYFFLKCGKIVIVWHEIEKPKTGYKF